MIERAWILLVVAACSKKEPAPDVVKSETKPADAATTMLADAAMATPADAPDDLPVDRIAYDLPMVGTHAGEFAVSFALLHLGSAETGQGDLVVFGPEIEEGDRGTAADYTDVCSTRLNAFPYGTVHGFRIYLSKVKELPVAGSKLEGSTVTFDLQGAGWGVTHATLKDHPFEPDIRLAKSDGAMAELEVRIREPGKPGSLRGRVRAKICPASR